MKSRQKEAKIRICASCEWVFDIKDSENTGTCPICEFASYGARWVLGKNYHKELKRQQPYIDRRLRNFMSGLYSEIEGKLPKRFKRRQPVFNWKFREGPDW